MSSFGAMGRFRSGYWIEFRRFVLQERRDVSKRLESINAEIERIGLVRVQYMRETIVETGETKVTEHRTGFSVSRGSTLEKLVQAYITQGGNPYDISYFFMPDETEVVTTSVGNKLSNNYPNGGVVSPRSADYNEPVGTYEAYPGGFASIKKYVGNRLGARDPHNDTTNAVVDLTHTARKWVNQEIKHKIQELEHRIIKLCDLREQLVQERDDVLVQACGGTLFVLPDFDEDRYVESLRVQSIVALIDSVMFDVDTTDGVQRSLKVNDDKIALTDTFYPDVAEEVYLSLMS